MSLLNDMRSLYQITRLIERGIRKGVDNQSQREGCQEEGEEKAKK